MKISKDGQVALDTSGDPIVLLAGSAHIMHRIVRSLVKNETEAVKLAKIVTERVMEEIKKKPR